MTTMEDRIEDQQRPDLKKKVDNEIFLTARSGKKSLMIRSEFKDDEHQGRQTTAEAEEVGVSTTIRVDAFLFDALMLCEYFLFSYHYYNGTKP